MTARKCINSIREFVESKGGKLHSDNYQNVNSILEISCNFGHKWKTKYDNIRKGSWCPNCGGRSKKSLDYANEKAKTFGGTCLSKKYISSKSKLEWECKYGHKWKAPLSYLDNYGYWCPECSCFSYERICRSIFEQIFGKPFPKVRPKWLINSNGNRLELDGYCEELGLAFEHNGVQHYTDVQYFKTDLKRIQEHDSIKQKLCNAYGVKLVIIPELYSMTDESEIIKCIESQIGIKIKKHVIIGVPSPKIDDLHNFANSKNGYCLSTFYKTASSKYLWKCQNNHEWKSSWNIVKNGKWCPICFVAFSKDQYFSEILTIVKSKNGEVLDRYIRSDYLMSWKCSENHIWKTTCAAIKRGHWCQKCHLKKK